MYVIMLGFLLFYANEGIFQEDAYPDSASVQLNRPKEQKLLLGDGCAKLLGEDYILDVRIFARRIDQMTNFLFYRSACISSRRSLA